MILAIQDANILIDLHQTGLPENCVNHENDTHEITALDTHLTCD